MHHRGGRGGHPPGPESDPPGIACVDLREPAASRRARESPEALPFRIVSEAWDLLLRRACPQIARQLGVRWPTSNPRSRSSDLETRPGRQYTNERAQYIEPDVVVVKVGDEYVIQLNDDGLPSCASAGPIAGCCARCAPGSQTAQQFIREKMRSALWLIKSLDQRQRTIYKVAESIVRQQRGFLDRGLDHLRPLVLRNVAEDIGMHESTVSRVVAN